MTDIVQLESLSEAEKGRLLSRPVPWDVGTYGDMPLLSDQVAEILAEVRRRGDAALRELTERFDGVRLNDLRVSQEAQRRALQALDPELQAALETAKRQIERFHEHQHLSSYHLEVAPGSELGQLVKPFRRVGLYVPRNLPSSLLMAAVPARLAGVAELAVCTPPGPDGRIPQIVQAAAALLEINELYAVGGAQAIAALAYGTESIGRVQKIAGPGNAYVTAAKALVQGEVGIDLLAGPSEILLIVDRVAKLSEATLARWSLSELRAQLEHGSGSSALLLTSLPKLAREVAQGLDPDEVRDRQVTVLHYQKQPVALDFVNAYAPEHLCLWSDGAEHWLEQIENAGSVFLGPWSPVALGDYASGTNHILPTAGRARFGGGLSVRDFVKTISYQRVSPQGLQALAPTAIALAQAEGMRAHAASIRMRLQEEGR
ncbi:MAG TPA: histidinol dehydrogenase [Candidatus Fraserbacteria bacterium]|mgnify:CR=1 FL=1|nr:histidinol dehydrogenase [Candidatus Fraserbacteria bacterium]